MHPCVGSQELGQGGGYRADGKQPHWDGEMIPGAVQWEEES